MLDFIVWVCPDCGRTVKGPNPSTWQPNTICQCQYPNHVTQMVQVWPFVNNSVVIEDADSQASDLLEEYYPDEEKEDVE